MKKKVALLIFTLLMVSLSYGQKTEYSFHVNSGLFSFRGMDAVKSSVMLNRNIPQGQFGSIYEYYTNDPYGTHPLISAGGSVQIERISKGNNIIGLQVGFERLRSKVLIDKVEVAMGNVTNAALADAEG